MMMIHRRWMSAVSQMRGIIGEQLSGIKDAGTWKTERVITSAQSSLINIAGSDEKMLNFCANNYLGLSVSDYNKSISE